MTELQLRLWCLWMCEEFAGLGDYVDEIYAAAEKAPIEMFDMLCGISDKVPTLTAWKLSERTP